jgi:uncharacterized protein (TIGR02145 family)
MINNKYHSKVNFKDQYPDFQFPGYLNENVSFSIKGYADEFRMYARVLNNKEIETLFMQKLILKPVFWPISVLLITKNSALVMSDLKYDGGAPVSQCGIYWDTIPSPDSLHYSGFIYNDITYIRGLKAGTSYFVRAFAINESGIGYSNEINFRTSPEDTVRVKDIEGNSYKTVKINQYRWMAENLKTTTYNDGSPIPNIKDNLEWAGLTYGAYCWYANEDSNRSIYGALYNYNVMIDERGVCPENWHVPSTLEWSTLPYGMFCVRGNVHCAITEEGNAHWCCLGGTNETGFTALPAGVRQGVSWWGNPYGAFRSLQFVTFFWMSNGEYYFIQTNDDVSFAEWTFVPSHANGYSIRCVQDNEFSGISTPDIHVIKGDTFEIPVEALDWPEGEVIGYQFKVRIDPAIGYTGFNTQGTLSAGADPVIQQSGDSLFVSWKNVQPIQTTGTLLKLKFKSLQTGKFAPVFSDLILNPHPLTIRLSPSLELDSIHNGSITVSLGPGDVDGNGAIQSYDAALALQYSAGLDPMPVLDPLPWEDWRIFSADVDQDSIVSAYDAALMLQYAVGLIDSFSRPDAAPQADVNVAIEDGYLVFRSSGELYGLNCRVNDPKQALGSPMVIDSSLFVAENITPDDYSIALAARVAPIENSVVLVIPLRGSSIPALTLLLKINRRQKEITLGMPTLFENHIGKRIIMFPNPASTILHFDNAGENTEISLYDMQGRIVMTHPVYGGQVDISNLSRGVYMVLIKSCDSTIIRKLVKN